MKQAKFRSKTLQSATLLLAALAACDGRSSVGAVGSSSAKPELLSIDVGRLVDIYAFQRIDPSAPDRADRRKRVDRNLVLVARNVVVNPGVESQSLFDASGAEVLTASYEFRPFDKNVGHEELVILWDNRPGPEAARFAAALAAAQTGLPSLAAAYRGQNTILRPIPVVPRNAALRLKFSSPLAVDAEFFRVNPSAIQLLEFKGDPSLVDPRETFRTLSFRAIPQGDQLVLDTTIQGGEGVGGLTTSGLPSSTDSVTANIRIAIPARGIASAAFYVKEDAIAELNGTDSAGRSAVIRDFRSGNLSDGVAGKLYEAEPPMIVGSIDMGIAAIDRAARTITLTKRGHFVPVRGRYPFVDGPLAGDGMPAGPGLVPIQQGLRSGDILTQTVEVPRPDGSKERVALRAEVLQNKRVPDGYLPTAAAGEEQGQMEPIVEVLVASLVGGYDSLGNPVEFEALPLSVDPQGRDCVLRTPYYERIPFVGSSLTLSDAGWRNQFVRIDPQPAAPAAPSAAITGVNPVSSIAIEFTKPMDLEQVDNSVNFLLSNKSVALESFTTQMSDPKKATARVVPSRLSDVAGDGTVLRLQAPLGLFHVGGATETYCMHVKLGGEGVADLAGNPLQVFGDAANPLDSWSVDFTLDSASPTNRVGWHSWLFTNADEDGSLPGSVDIFGQYRMQGGRLFAAAGVRFSRTADAQNMQAIDRLDGGECWDEANLAGPVGGGPLYALPVVPSGVIEPLNPRGSRMQTRYIEDDFTLDRREPVEMGIDVEQLYWSPFNDGAVYYDVFDRYSMSLAHGGRRPDIRWQLVDAPPNVPPDPPVCTFICAAMNSSLSKVFNDNVLPGSSAVPVFEDKVYKINPNEVFRSSFNIKYVPYPRFDRTYTWRDSRLVTVDASGQIIGLGGASQPNIAEPNNDMTANVDSPWIGNAAPPGWLAAGGIKWNEDDADFLGDRTHDHDPIALPLLVDFKVFPDSAVNGVASGANMFQMAAVGSYYDAPGSNCFPPPMPQWPATRAQASGGEDLITGAPIYVYPSNQNEAQDSNLWDTGLNVRLQRPAIDGMLNWAQADFVRKVSTMTFGFIDTLQPQRAIFVVDPTVTPPSAVPDVGFPNLLAISPDLRISELVTQIDPPQRFQPAGTSVVLEVRGAETIGNPTVPVALYNPGFVNTFQAPDDLVGTRGNLLNPNYACEAYRYSQANPSPRVAATGLTPYVTDGDLELIRDPATDLLPRFMNVRLTMTNNVDVSPSLSPSLRSMSIVYRLVPNQ